MSSFKAFYGDKTNSSDKKQHEQNFDVFAVRTKALNMAATRKYLEKQLAKVVAF